MMRTPPHSALIILASASGSSSPASDVWAGRNGSPKFEITPPMPQRLAIATPFHRPSPWCASSYPAWLNVSTGASASASFVSCIRSTSGFVRSSHHMTFSRRAFSELTFQVAIRMSKDHPTLDRILWRESFCIMEDDAESEARTGANRTHAVPHVDSVIASASFYGTVPRCKDHDFTLLGR